jgi:hypothetical protein
VVFTETVMVAGVLPVEGVAVNHVPPLVAIVKEAVGALVIVSDCEAGAVPLIV